MKKYKFEIGKLYEIEYLDHYDTDDHSSENAIKAGDLTLKCYGKFVGKNKNYIVLCWNYENETSNNNDNMHILKNVIINVRELK